MDASTDSLASAIDASVASFDGVSAAVDDAFATAHDGRETVSQSLITNADGLADQAANYAQLADSLDALAKGMPDGSSVELTQMASTLRAVSTTMERLSRQLGTTAGDLNMAFLAPRLRATTSMRKSPRQNSRCKTLKTSTTMK